MADFTAKMNLLDEHYTPQGHPEQDRAKDGCLGCEENRALDHAEGMHAEDPCPDVCIDCDEMED